VIEVVLPHGAQQTLMVSEAASQPCSPKVAQQRFAFWGGCFATLLKQPRCAAKFYNNDGCANMLVPHFFQSQSKRGSSVDAAYI
jgi:hypothetical protein